MDARTQRRLRRAEIREKNLKKEAEKNKKVEKWAWRRKTNEKMCKDYCEKATHEMQQAEDVKKVIEHCYQNTPNLVDIKLLNHHLKEKNLVIMSLKEVEEKNKDIEIYRSNIWRVYNMIKKDLHNFNRITPLVKTVIDLLKHVHKILGCTIWPNPIPQHMFQTDV